MALLPQGFELIQKVCCIVPFRIVWNLCLNGSCALILKIFHWSEDPGRILGILINFFPLSRTAIFTLLTQTQTDTESLIWKLCHSLRYYSKLCWEKELHWWHRVTCGKLCREAKTFKVWKLFQPIRLLFTDSAIKLKQDDPNWGSKWSHASPNPLYPIFGGRGRYSKFFFRAQNCQNSSHIFQGTGCVLTSFPIFTPSTISLANTMWPPW